MAALNKDAVVSVRLTKPERKELDDTALLRGEQPAPLAAAYVREGLRRCRFPAVDFRDGSPGRVAYLLGSRWPVWMIVELVRELGGGTAKAAKRMKRPEPLVRQALAYAEAYPEEIEASLRLHAQRNYDGLKRLVPNLERL